MIEERQYKLLEILVNNQDSFITGDGLSQILYYSKRTIQNDIQILKRELKDNGAAICSEGGKGYRLFIENEKKFFEYYQEIQSIVFLDNTKEGRKISILLSILFKKDTDISYLASKNYISISTVSNDLNYYKAVLDKYLIQLIRTKDSIKIEGNERNIRQFIYQEIAKDRYEFLKSYSECGFMLDFAEEIVEKIVRQHQISLTDYSFRKIVLYLWILINRNLVGYKLEDNKTIQEFKPETEYNIAKKIITDLSQIYQIEINDNEILFLASKYYGEIIYNEEETSGKGIEKIISDLFDYLYYCFGYRFPESNYTRKILAYHIAGMQERAKNHIDLDISLPEKLIENYTATYNYAVVAVNYLESVFRYHFNDNEIGCMCIYLNFAGENVAEKKKKKALLVFSEGRTTAFYISREIKKRFRNEIEEIDLCNRYSYNDQKQSGYDLILSITKPNIDKKEVCDISSDKDRYDSEKLNAFLKLNKDKNNVSSLFKRSLFFNDVGKEEIKDVLAFLGEKMKEVKNCNESVNDELLERYKMGHTVFEHKLAVVPTVGRFGEKTVISVAIFDKPITFENKEVLLLFCISPKYHNADLDINLFYNFISFLLLHPKRINEIIENNSYEYLLTIINEASGYSNK